MIGAQGAAKPPEPRAPASRFRYAVVDTTFSRVDMGRFAEDRLRALGVPEHNILRRTVPGFKDLAVACKKLIEEEGCHIAIACGMPGPEPIDKQCGHEASLAIGQAQLMTNTHILEVFCHMDEADSDEALWRLCEDRVTEHAENAWKLLERPDLLRAEAGTGQRQGFADVGPVTLQESGRAEGRLR